MPTYKNFALLYDELMKDAPYDKWIQFTKKILPKKQINHVVDLGCGTGEITIRLAKEFNHVYGIDLSESMLTIAQQKAIAEKVDVTWIEQDIRNLTGFQDVELFISYCDVINYIIDKNDVKRVFENVHRSLTNGGLFIFDFHSMEHVKKNLIDKTFSYTDENIAYIWHCLPTNTPGEMVHDMTFFHKRTQQSTCYERFEEVHYQRTFSMDTYKQLLEDANFTKIEFYSDFSYENTISERKSERIFVVAQK